MPMPACFGGLLVCLRGGHTTEHKRFLEAARDGDDNAAAASLTHRPELALSTTLLHRKTALHLAAERGHDTVMASILETLLCQASHGDGLLKADAAGPGSRGSGQIMAERIGSANLAQLDPEVQVAALINSRDADGRTPLIIACGHNHVECARLLLSNGAWREPVDHRGNSALHYASARGYLGIMLMLLTDFTEELKAEQLEYLRSGRVAAAVAVGPLAGSSTGGAPGGGSAGGGTERGAEQGRASSSSAAPGPGSARGGSSVRMDPVALAQAAANLPDVKRLADMRNGAGFAPLHYAVWSKQSGAVQVLLQHGASLLARNTRAGIETSIPCPSNSTPLHLAAMRGHIEISRILLKTHYERVMEPMLLAAAVSGQDGEALARALAEVDPRTQSNNMGLMPYKVAHRTGYLSLASLLRPQIPLARLFNEEEHRQRFYGPPALKLLAAEALNRKLLTALDKAIATARELGADVEVAVSGAGAGPTALKAGGVAPAAPAAAAPAGTSAGVSGVPPVAGGTGMPAVSAPSSAAGDDVPPHHESVTPRLSGLMPTVREEDEVAAARPGDSLAQVASATVLVVAAAAGTLNQEQEDDVGEEVEEDEEQLQEAVRAAGTAAAAAATAGVPQPPAPRHITTSSQPGPATAMAAALAAVHKPRGGQASPVSLLNSLSSFGTMASVGYNHITSTSTAPGSSSTPCMGHLGLKSAPTSVEPVVEASGESPFMLQGSLSPSMVRDRSAFAAVSLDPGGGIPDAEEGADGDSKRACDGASPTTLGAAAAGTGDEQGVLTTVTSLSTGVVVLQRGASVSLVGGGASSQMPAGAAGPLAPLMVVDQLSGLVEDTVVEQAGAARRGGRMGSCLPGGMAGMPSESQDHGCVHDMHVGTVHVAGASPPPGGPRAGMAAQSPAATPTHRRSATGGGLAAAGVSGSELADPALSPAAAASQSTTANVTLSVLRTVRRSLSGLRPTLSGQLHRHDSTPAPAHTAAADSCTAPASPRPPLASASAQGDQGGAGQGQAHDNSNMCGGPGAGAGQCGANRAAPPGTDTDEDECGVCLEHPALVLVQPCNHSICGPCAKQMCSLNAQRVPICPFCRSLIANFDSNLPLLARRKATLGASSTAVCEQHAA